MTYSLKPEWRMWLEINGIHVIGKGGFRILKAIDRLGSISRACKELGMSYRFVWGYLNRIERVLGGKVVERVRGGAERGGTRLTELGRKLLYTYEMYENIIKSALKGVRGKVREVKGRTVVLELECERDVSEGEEVILAHLGDP